MKMYNQSVEQNKPIMLISQEVIGADGVKLKKQFLTLTFQKMG